MLGSMCCEAWQTARPTQVETSAQFAMDHTTQNSIEEDLNWPHHSPSLCHFLSPFPICKSVYHQPFLPPPPLHLLKTIMLPCMGCLHPPCRIEAVSAKTTMWETANSSYSNTQLAFMRSSATLWCFDFSLHGVLAANTDTIDVPASPWANII